MELSGANALVTGAAGFIGSHLVEALHDAGARVTAFVHYDSRPDLANLELVRPDVRRAIQVIAGDVTDPFSVARAVAGQAIVFHLAALIPIPYSYVAPASFVRTNVEGTLNVLESCRTAGVRRLINTSTSETYGTALYTPIDEKHALQAQSPYAASKIGAEKLADSYHLSFGLPVTTVKPFNTYGPRQSARAVIPTIASQAVASPAIRIGSLSPVRDFTYVSDTVEGFLAVARADETIGRVVNLGTGTGVTVGELARKILAAAGVEKPLEVEEERIRPATSEVMQLICSAEAARRLTGWRPQVGLDEGLGRVVEFVRAHPHRFRPDAYVR